MESRGLLLTSGGWADAFADRTRQRFLAACQFSSPVTVAVATRTEQLLSLGKREIIGPPRQRAVGLTLASSVRLGRCDLA
jgi:hypothetical protein